MLDLLVESPLNPMGKARVAPLFPTNQPLCPTGMEVEKTGRSLFPTGGKGRLATVAEGLGRRVVA
ncbi:protein of unknown function [Azospirillum lipoferum 4B]|uniref:Uncharacterized protein n=1 Tax=Azospirillum lipoferum (strain 4B) TaxID=862719 RepID=G7Z6D1_AZOL4|nr:protein of unknown function [Azospirillum lipoferum 4B]